MAFQLWFLGIAQLSVRARGLSSFSDVDVKNRRSFIFCGGALASASAASLALPLRSPASTPPPADTVYGEILSLFDAKTIPWTTRAPSSGDAPSWNDLRYRTSTLRTTVDDAAPAPARPAFYPAWMAGHWSVRYRFDGASFPQGRTVLSLRTAGAGLGTCLSLPNVGYSPPAHAAHFFKRSSDAYEDLAYNAPRKMEAFWPQSKVLSVCTDGRRRPDEVAVAGLSTKCFVTGDGCAVEENDALHLPASRVALDFEAPTRRSGRRTQSLDVSMVEDVDGRGPGGGSHAASRNYSQFNVDQELQTFYKEISYWEEIEDQNQVVGKIRVAAFLPKYIKGLDAGNSAQDYDENSAVAVYDYKILMKSISESEAASI